MTTKPMHTASFNTFGDLLKYLRRRQRLTQLELSIAVGYSEAQISRLEQNQRLPDLATVQALFIPALHLENEPEIVARLLELAETARQEDAPTAGLPPYKGLLFFDEADSDLFFGRETLTAQLADRITALASDASTHFLAVVGASGSGKSSLVRAGLAVTLKRRGWEVRTFTPTATPLRALEAELHAVNHDHSRKVLFVVDQFEETFTLCRDETERSTFMDQLLKLAQAPESKTFVTITLRADFYSHCAQYPRLRQAVAAEQEYIGQMSVTELRRAIEEPAKRGGWEFERGLVDLLLNDIGAHGTNEPEPGALPLLSHALLATWERRRGRTFTLEGYRASGGVRGAIAETAENVFTDQLDRSQQALAREVFLRLTELGEGTEDTRRRAALNELVRQSQEAVQLRGVLNTLAEARLITLNADSAEVAHEALIREWQRLREWLTQDREGLRLHRHLTESAQEWEARERDPAELYRGARLAQAREWAQSNAERLNPSERAFLQAAVEREEHDALEREAQRQRELDSARKLFEAEQQATGRMRRVSLVLLASLVLAVILAGFAFRLNRLATSRELAAAAVGQLEVDPELSMLLALEALNRAHTREAEEALHQAVMAARVIERIPLDDELLSVAYSPDGSVLATAGRDGVVTVLDAETNKIVLSIEAHPRAITQVAFSPTGDLLATASADWTTKLWEVKTGALLTTFTGHTATVSGLAFSPDGSILATVSLDGTLRLWDVADRTLILTGPQRTHDRLQLTAVVFSPDGKRLATASEQSVIEIWEVESNEPVSALFNPDLLPITDLSFSPDGSMLATSNGSFVRLWELATGENTLTFTGHNNIVNTLTFSADGSSIASAGLDRTIQLWDVRTGQVFITLAGGLGEIHAIALRPDAPQLASVGSDGHVMLWDMGPVREVYALETPDAFKRLAISADGRWVAEGVGLEAKIWEVATGAEVYSLLHTSWITSVAFSPDRTLLATTDVDSVVQVWDLNTQSVILTMEAGRTSLNAVAFNPNGQQLASGGEDGIVRVWDARSGNLIFVLSGHFNPVTSLAYSPDGTWLVSGGVDNIAVLWDVTTGDKSNILRGHTDVVWGVDVSPDGKHIVTASRDATVRVWDADSGDELLTLNGHTGTVVSAAFSPDGKQIASAGMDGLTNLWNADSGELLVTLHGDGSGTESVDFTPDGQFLLTASNALRVYAVRLDDLMALATSRLTRTWTLEECQKFLRMDTCPSVP